MWVATLGFISSSKIGPASMGRNRWFRRRGTVKWPIRWRIIRLDGTITIQP
jgi:hypothetical protein